MKQNMMESTGMTYDECDVILEAAVANYAEDSALAPNHRALSPKKFRFLHDTLVSLAEIHPQDDDFQWEPSSP